MSASTPDGTTSGTPLPPSASDDSPGPRASYHHGDLKSALVRTGYDVARTQGPEAVSLRALTRAVGVTPGAAYRHFANGDQLMHAISLRAMADLARSIEAHQAVVTGDDAAQRARDQLTAVGTGYVDFALDEPGGFGVALSSLLTMEHSNDPDGAGETGRTPFQLLHDALEGLVVTGQLDADRAEPAAILCWSSVHGFASLATRGPLRMMPRAELDALAAQLVRGIVEGVIRQGAPRS